MRQVSSAALSPVHVRFILYMTAFCFCTVHEPHQHTANHECLTIKHVATQKFKAINNIIRVNATDLYVFKLRNQVDLDSLLDEVSAVADKKIILEMNSIATKEPYSFLYVKLTSKDPNKLFMIKFHHYLELE